MVPLPLIYQIYIVCAAIGSIFLVACAFMGAHHAGSGGHAGHTGVGGHTGLGGQSGVGGHTGIGHSGAAGHAAIGHSGSASGGHSIGQTGHAGAAHGGASGGAHAGSAQGTNAGANEIIQLQASTGPFSRTHPRRRARRSSRSYFECAKPHNHHYIPCLFWTDWSVLRFDLSGVGICHPGARFHRWLHRRESGDNGDERYVCKNVFIFGGHRAGVDRSHG